MGGHDAYPRAYRGPLTRDSNGNLIADPSGTGTPALPLENCTCDVCRGNHQTLGQAYAELPNLGERLAERHRLAERQHERHQTFLLQRERHQTSSPTTSGLRSASAASALAGYSTR